MIAVIRTTALALIGGWLAQCLADTDDDVDHAVAHYDAKAYDEALAALDAAQARLGERPELSLNRGLIMLAKGDREAAKKAFEHATESSDPQVAASGFYQLGNLALDDESWENAIDRYTAALKLIPEHQHAKWNLELALQRKDQDDSSSSSSSDSTSNDDSTSSNSASDSSSTGSSSNGSSSSDSPSGDSTGSDSTSSDSPGDDESSSDTPSGDGSSTGSNGTPSTPNNESGEGSNAPNSDAGASGPAPAPIDRADLDKALEQLDREDSFNFGAPNQNAAPVEKDW